MKKLLALALSTMMIFVMGTTSFADEPVRSASTKTVTSPDMVQEINDPDILKSFSEMEPLKEGESKIIGYIDGEPLKATAGKTYTDDTMTAGLYQTANHTWFITYGANHLAFIVELDVLYYNNGNSAESYIDSMRGTYTIIDDSFSCEWNSSKHVSSQWTHILSLTAHRYFSSDDFYFSAMFDGSGVQFYAD